VVLPDPEAITGKGTTLKAALAYVEAEHGETGLDRLRAALGDDTRTLVSGLVLPSAKIPIPRLVEVYEAIDRVFGRGDLTLCWDIGRFAGEFEVNMLHKVFLQIAKIDYWLKLAGASWRHYYSAGTLSHDVEREHGWVSLSDFNPVSKAFCFRFGGWLHRILELSRFSDVEVSHPECLLDGKPACIWRGTWTA
jgi:hypothetical protein